MMKQTKTQIFLANERGLNETGWFRSQQTFNFGRYQDEFKKPFGPIYIINDEMLAGGREISLEAEENSFVIVLPLAGAVSSGKNNSVKKLVAAGQTIIEFVEKGNSISISNPFANETVNFLQIWIKAKDLKTNHDPDSHTYPDVNESRNLLVPVLTSNELPFSMHLGKFEGRGETIYNIKPGNGCFVFVLNGAFESEGRLLHERDALSVWETDQIELEALSNEAIILLIEVPI